MAGCRSPLIISKATIVKGATIVVAMNGLLKTMVKKVKLSQSTL
jgi:hypothetical protein